MDVSICIPAKNGGELFRQVLEAVFRQRTRLRYEVICVDSGSTDGTLEIIRSYPEIRLKQIAPETFGHGKTRNLAASLGTGEFIVFLTQDAIPAWEGWLEEMVGAIRTDERIALCFGIHYPYPDCNPLDRRDIEGHFRNFGKTNTVYWLEDPERYAREEGYRHLLAFSSDNNACLRRSVFEQFPYPDAEFAEDQIWTRQMMEKGYRKIYCPYAPVYHSHNYPAGEYFRRYYDEYKGLRQVHDYRLVSARGAVAGKAAELLKRDVAYIRSLPMTYGEKFHWCRDALLRDVYRARAGWLGGSWQERPERERERMDRRCSQQKARRKRKAAPNPRVWTREELWAMTGNPLEKDGLIHPERAFGFVLEREEIPFRPEEQAAAAAGPRTVHWVIPEPRKGSGGHITIFRCVSALQKQGIRNRVYVLNPQEMKEDAALRAFLREHFPVLDPSVEVHSGCEDMPFCHGIIATGWVTAYFVRRFQNTQAKFYFVQDFEPWFYPMGSEYRLAENTYRFGFRGITAGDWLKEKLEKEYRMTCDSFRFSCDKEVFTPARKADDRPRVFFYARPVTPRRGWEIGLMALTELSRRVPELEVVFAGWDVSAYYIPFAHRSVGTAPLETLAELYGQCDLCLVMSLTNLSLMPLEVMAAGSVIVTQEEANNSWMISRENAVIVDTDPVHIAETMEDCLKHPEKLAPLREAGMRMARETDWGTETEKVCRSILGGLG